VALAGEFQVNTYTASNQNVPAIAAESNGDFVVVWQSLNQEGAGYGVFARRFSSAGTALAVEFVTNSLLLVGNQHDPTVASDSDGDLVIAWEEGGTRNDIFARRFSSAGAALAVEFQVNSYTPSLQAEPSVAVDGDGDFVIAWESYGQDAYYSGVFARRFSSAGTPLAGEFQVNVSTVGYQESPSVAADADGDFVVAWLNYPEEQAFAQDVLARRFTSSGAATAGEFRINDHTPDKQRRPSVAALGGSGFLVSWESYVQDASSVGVFARLLSNVGSRLGTELQINSYTSGQQRFPAVAAGAGGTFVVAWQSVHDGSSSGVFAQRLAALATLDIDGNLSVQALTDGLLLLRYLFGFRGTTLVAGAVDLIGCTRCDSGAIEAYLSAVPLVLADLAQVNRQGAEFQVNGFTPSNQREQVVAIDGDGDFVVVWSSNGQDGSSYGVFARRFSSAGTRLGAEFQISSYTSSDQNARAIAMETNGDFVVAWEDFDRDGFGAGVFARRFSSAGSPLATDFQVNAYTTGQQGSPSVAVDADGDFVVAWYSDVQDGSGYGIFARRFTSSGAALATEFQINSFTTGRQDRPKVAANVDGDFVVVWDSLQDGQLYGVFGRRFSSAGAALAVEFQINTYTMSGQLAASLEMDPDGDFLAVWNSSTQDGSDIGSFGRRFSSAGDALAVEFQINAYTPGNQSLPELTSLTDGTFVVTWTSNQDGSGAGVAARRFTSTGGALTPELQVNSYTQPDQRSPKVAAAGSRFLVVWSSNPQDGSEEGVFGQRLVVPTTFDIDGNGMLEALTDGLLVLRYVFGFRGATLITGAVGADCSRCAASSIEAYLAGLTG
jgi:hypothetical protein